jgi:hypothetical protein
VEAFLAVEALLSELLSDKLLMAVILWLALFYILVHDNPEVD